MDPEFLFAPGEMSFHRAKRPVKEGGDFVMRAALLITQVNGELFVGSKRAEGERKIVAQIRRHRGVFRVGIHRFGTELGVIALPPAGVAPVVVRDAQQPGRKIRITAKTADCVVRLHERLLSQVVGQRRIAAEVTKELAHRGLMTLHERAESGAIVDREHARDQLVVRRVHDFGGRESLVEDFLSLGSRTRPKSNSATPMKPGMAPTNPSPRSMNEPKKT